MPGSNKSGKPKKGTTYTRALGERICERVAEGETLAAVCREMGIPRARAVNWTLRYKAFGELYKRACDLRMLALEDKLTEICDEATAVALDTECGKERVNACKLKADIVKWQLSKLMPKTYGDRTQMEVTGADGKDLLPKHSLEDMREFAAVIAAAQAATPPRRDEDDPDSEDDEV